MHFDGIEPWGFTISWTFGLGGNGFHGICPHRTIILYNLIPHIMDFDGIVCLVDSKFHGLLALGAMDFMKFVPTEQSFHAIPSLMSGNFVQSDLIGIVNFIKSNMDWVDCCFRHPQIIIFFDPYPTISLQSHIFLHMSDPVSLPSPSQTSENISVIYPVFLKKNATLYYGCPV
jgi:hypothetical protein